MCYSLSFVSTNQFHIHRDPLINFGISWLYTINVYSAVIFSCGYNDYLINTREPCLRENKITSLMVNVCKKKKKEPDPLVIGLQASVLAAMKRTEGDHAGMR